MATLVLKLGGRELKRVGIWRTVTRIGRDESCELRIENQAVSRKHARVVFTGGRFAIIDTGSGNGIRVDDRQVPEAYLDDGVEIQLGKFTVVFLADGGAALDKLVPVGMMEERQSVSDVVDTTHLDPEYMSKLRDALDDRDRERRLVDERRNSQLEQRATGAQRLILLLVLTVAGLAAAVVYLLISPQ